ncbi:MAG: hypothetical protein RL358_27 [Pseudomonadota bacterium]
MFVLATSILHGKIDKGNDVKHTNEARQLLENSPLFRGIPSGLLNKCLSRSTIRSVTLGKTLLTPGQVNNLTYIILSGRLSIQTKESAVEPIAMLGEGECVGEMSILGGGNVSAFVITATDCRLLAIDHTALWELIDKSHVAAHNMLSILTKRIRVADQFMGESLEHHNGFSSVPMVDELTGLYSRHWMYTKFERCLQRSIMNNQPGCVMILEMDQFASFASSYGQLGSDQALRNIAHIMLSLLRPGDQMGHYIGEQFAAFLPNTSLFDAGIAAERLRSSISRAMVVLPSGDALPSTTISVGISQVTPTDTLVGLFARADEAMQQAKQGGGNGIRCVK